MNFKRVPAIVSAFVLLAAAAGTSSVSADELTMLQNVPSTAHVPQRGMSMAQVEKQFGAPDAKLPTAGGDTPLHPPINRWRYNGYIVYFERNRVIHSVIDGTPRAGS